MEWKITQGDFAMAGGRPVVLTGGAELLQRVSLALCTRRGSLEARPDFGSRLHTLVRRKPSQRQSVALALVQEALAQEAELTVQEVTLVPLHRGGVVLRVALTWHKTGETLQWEEQLW